MNFRELPEEKQTEIYVESARTIWDAVNGVIKKLAEVDADNIDLQLVMEMVLERLDTHFQTDLSKNGPLVILDEPDKT